MAQAEHPQPSDVDCGCVSEVLPLRREPPVAVEAQVAQVAVQTWNWHLGIEIASATSVDVALIRPAPLVERFPDQQEAVEGPNMVHLCHLAP